MHAKTCERATKIATRKNVHVGDRPIGMWFLFLIIYLITHTVKFVYGSRKVYEISDSSQNLYKFILSLDGDLTLQH